MLTMAMPIKVFPLGGLGEECVLSTPRLHACKPCLKFLLHWIFPLFWQKGVR